MKGNVVTWDSPVLSEWHAELAAIVQKKRDLETAHTLEYDDLKHVLGHDEIKALERGAARYECSVAVFHVAVTEWYSLLRARGVVDEKLPLGFDHKPSVLTSAVDVFAMDESLSASGEGLWNAAMAVVDSGRRDPTSNRLQDVNL